MLRNSLDTVRQFVAVHSNTDTVNSLTSPIRDALLWIRSLAVNILSYIGTFFAAIGDALVVAITSVLWFFKTLSLIIVVVTAAVCLLRLSIWLLPRLFNFCFWIYHAREAQREAKFHKQRRTTHSQEQDFQRQLRELRQSYGRLQNQYGQNAARVAELERELRDVLKRTKAEGGSAKSGRSGAKAKSNTDAEADFATKKGAQEQALRKKLNQWQVDAERCFRNMPGAQAFPDPPLQACKVCKLKVHTVKEKPILDFCEHSLERLLRLREDGSYATILKDEERRWHPDRFARAPKNLKEDMMKKATVMFQLFQILLAKERK